MRLGASVTVDIWSGRCIKDSLIAATTHYVADGYLRNASLGLRELYEHHDAHTIEQARLKILANVGIGKLSRHKA